MIEAAIPTLTLVAAAAVLAPLIADRTGSRVPAIVIELVLGILMGPFVLKLVHPNSIVTGLSDMGLTFLMFLAGFEFEPHQVKGRPIRLATLGWLLSLGLALAFAFALVSSGLALDTVVIGLALTTTALGALLPIVGDAGLREAPVGRQLLAVGTVGEFAPIVMVAVLLVHKDPVATSVLLVAFVAITAVVALLVSRSFRPRLVELLQRHLDSSAQLPVRISVLLVLSLIYLALQFGLDVLLGAFAAGMIARSLVVGKDHDVVQGKLEAIGFGFLVPIFFVVSGVRFDLHVLLHRPTAILRLALFLAAMLVIRGAPALLLYRNDLSRPDRVSLAFLSATGLPLIVVITTIAATEGRIRPENAAALVGAGLLSLVLFPMIGLRNRLRGTAAVLR